MTKLFFTSLLFIFISIFPNLINANEVWITGANDMRSYLVLDSENGIQLKLYSQNAGDYQDLISVQFFNNVIGAYKYIKIHHPNYKPISKLLKWPVDSSASDKKNDNLWIVQNMWTDEWENQYADWLRKEISSDFYLKYNLSTDCADALIGFRWIFARIHFLPVANTLSDTGLLFGQFSMRKKWANLSTSLNWYDDQLFLAALSYVMDMTSTRTIMQNDGFHVGITKKGLRAGTFIVSQTNGSGHIRTITENYFDEIGVMPIFTHSSTAPREVRSLYREAFIDQAWPIKGVREIMAFRWPIVRGSSWLLTEKNRDPRFSSEQFNTTLQEGYYSFIQFVLNRIKPTFNPSELVTTGIVDLLNYTTIRITIARNGFEFCQSHNCNPGTQAYEDWSTPNRDLKYLIKFNEIEDLVKSFDPSNPGLFASWIRLLNSTIINVEGYDLSLSQIRMLLEKNQMSFIPSDPILKRWGIIEN